ncbi:MAG: AbrB/MazE/SpoVT family DNA-binding domain-containing protein [Promethearchaeota archaeon]
MVQEIIMDTKGRILVPLEIRKQLNFEPGERFIVTIENGRLVLLKSGSYEEFMQEIKEFQQELQKVTQKPISTERLF